MNISIYNAIKKILNENVEPKDVNDAIENQYQVIIKYSDEENHAPDKRVIEPYVYGLSKANNPVIRGFQYYGDTYRGVPHWKLFRLDRITYWQPTNNHFNASPSERGWNAEVYKANADADMSQVFSYVSFDRNTENDYTDLDALRNKTRQMQQSTPINIRDLSKEPQQQQQVQKNTEPQSPTANTNYKEPIAKEKPTKPNDINIDNKDNDSLDKYKTKDFQDMLKRNLEITRKEKERRKFDINKTKDKEKDGFQ